jgi:hypothetical protein
LDEVLKPEGGDKRKSPHDCNTNNYKDFFYQRQRGADGDLLGSNTYIKIKSLEKAPID